MDEFAVYYDLFNLRPGASNQDLKDAYKRLAKQWHPDRFVGDPINAKIAEEKIKTINVAYEALKAYQESPYSDSTTRSSASYTTSVKTHRASPEDYYNNAKRLIKVGQYREAAEELGHAVKIDPNYAAAYHLRGILFSALGFENRGSSDFKRASEYGVTTIDYDDEIIELVRNHKEFKYLSYLLKTQTHHQTARNKSTANSSRANAKKYSAGSDYQASENSGNTQVKEAGFIAKLKLEADFSQGIESITAIAASVNIRTLATGYSDGSIDLWNYKNKRSFYCLKGHIGVVTRLAFSPDNQLLFSSGQDGTMRLWNLSDGSLIKKINAHDQGIETFAIDYAAKSLITVGVGGEAAIWDFRQGKLLKNLSHPEASVSLLALGSAGLFTICGSTDGSIHLCPVLKGGKATSITAHTHPVQALVFSSEHQIFASGASNGDVVIWQFPSGKRRQTCQSAQSGIVALTFSQQGRLLCGADEQGRIMVWDVASGALLDTISAHGQGRVNLITVADAILLSAGADGCIRQWHVQIQP